MEKKKSDGVKSGREGDPGILEEELGGGGDDAV